MNRKIAVLINPVAGKGKAIETLPLILEMFEPYKGEIELSIHVSKYKSDITTLTKMCIEKSIYEFIALGGDGTLFELVNGLPEDSTVLKQIKIALLPLGTGNDFVKAVSDKREISEILKRVIENKTQSIDFGTVNQHKFINSCSFGIDGPIIQKTEKLKDKVSGSAAYMMSTLSTALHYKAPMMRITIDDTVIEKEILLLAIGNGKYIGGGMKIFPDSDLTDDLLEVCVVEKVSPLKFLKEFKKIYKGRLNEIKEVHYYKAKNIRVEAINGVTFINADGNLIGTDPADISVGKEQINIFN